MRFILSVLILAACAATANATDCVQAFCGGNVVEEVQVDYVPAQRVQRVQRVRRVRQVQRVQNVQVVERVQVVQRRRAVVVAPFFVGVF